MSKIKDPNAVLDFAFNLRDTTKGDPWLADGETITAFTLTVTPTGLTVAPSGHPSSESGGLVTYWLAGGTAGITYDVTCHVTTSEGRQDDRTERVTVQDR